MNKHITSRVNLRYCVYWIVFILPAYSIHRLFIAQKYKRSLKHFIIQQMHKYIIRRYNLSYYKIFINI